MSDLQTQLMRPFPIDKVKWRVGATTKDKSKGIALAYVDSRMVMARLDEVVGIGGWQCRYPFAGCCEIGILMYPFHPIDGDGIMLTERTWIWKANGAGETNVEGEKGQYSDAFKRAAVMWGVGRYLYALPNAWVELDEWKRIINPPELPKWSTPEGYDEIMEKRNG